MGVEVVGDDEHFLDGSAITSHGAPVDSCKSDRSSRWLPEPAQQGRTALCRGEQMADDPVRRNQQRRTVRLCMIMLIAGIPADFFMLLHH